MCVHKHVEELHDKYLKPVVRIWAYKRGQKILEK